MEKKCNRSKVIVLTIVLIHFIMSLVINALFVIFDTTILTGFVGAASPLICFICMAFEDGRLSIVTLCCFIIVIIAIISSFIVGMIKKKPAIYSIGIFSDVLVRILLMTCLNPGYWEMPIAWTGVFNNFALLLIIVIIEFKGAKGTVSVKTNS